MSRENAGISRFKVGESISLEEITEGMKLEIKYADGITRHVRVVGGFVQGSEHHSGKGSILAKCYTWPDTGMPLFEKETEPLPGQDEVEITYAQDFQNHYAITVPIIAVYYQGVWGEKDRYSPLHIKFPFPHPRV